MPAASRVPNSMRELQVLEGDYTDYRVKRGLAFLLSSAYSTFEVVSPLDPVMLRQRVLRWQCTGLPARRRVRSLWPPWLRRCHRNNLRHYSRAHTGWPLCGFARAAGAHQFRGTPTPEILLHRYNLAQAQGVLYRASSVTITAYRNDPGEYKLLFRYLKLFGLMTYIEGDADHGFTLTIDGPTSLFKPSTRYGLALAKLLPALLRE